MITEYGIAEPVEKYYILSRHYMIMNFIQLF